MPTVPVCKKCDTELLADSRYADVLYCPAEGCSYGTVRAVAKYRVVQPKLPGLDPGRQVVTVKVAEKDLQAQVVAALQGRGYEVLEVGKSRAGVKCSQCGTFTVATGWQGNTPGTPDLQIRGAAWPVGVWLDVEMKGSGTPISDDQQRLCDRGGSYICWTWEEVWAAVVETDKRLNSPGETI